MLWKQGQHTAHSSQRSAHLVYTASVLCVYIVLGNRNRSETFWLLIRKQTDAFIDCLEPQRHGPGAGRAEPFTPCPSPSLVPCSLPPQGLTWVRDSEVFPHPWYSKCLLVTTLTVSTPSHDPTQTADPKGACTKIYRGVTYMLLISLEEVLKSLQANLTINHSA